MKMNNSPVKCDLSEKQTLQHRLHCVEELTEFTANCKNQLDELLETLGWTQENGQDLEPMEVCPYDSNHRVPSRSMERHKVSCQLSKMGYSHEEQAEMLDPSVCYEKGNISCFTMDNLTQRQVILQARSSAPPMRMEGLYSQGDFSKDPPEVPQNHKRAICDLTVADRLALYDHVTRMASQPKEEGGASNNEDLYIDLVAKLKKAENQNEPKSHLELMAEMRDYKRRRQSYRAKNVHITKKSYTEVVREVIHVHSGELARQWKDEQREEEKLRETQRNPPRRRSGDRRSPSAESRPALVSSRKGHGKRRRSRERSEERGRESGAEPSRERGREQEGKKKRKRDSRSPDERHHEKKKKKKKKKKEEEKEGREREVIVEEVLIS